MKRYSTYINLYRQCMNSGFSSQDARDYAQMEIDRLETAERAAIAERTEAMNSTNSQMASHTPNHPILMLPAPGHVPTIHTPKPAPAIPLRRGRNRAPVQEQKVRALKPVPPPTDLAAFIKPNSRSVDKARAFACRVPTSLDPDLMSEADWRAQYGEYGEYY